MTTNNNAEESRRAVTDAKARLAEIADMLDEAADELQSAEWKRNRGDTTVLGELGPLRDRVRDLTAMHNGAQRQVVLAEREVIADDLGLAEALAEHIESITGVPVSITNERPTKAPRGNLPKIVLVQRKPHTLHAHDGFLSGRVVAYYVRSPLHSPITSSLGEELDDRGVRLKGRPRISVVELPGGMLADRVELEVSVCWPVGLPVIASGPTSPSDVQRFGDAVAASAELSGHVGGASFGVRTGSGIAGAPLPQATARKIGASMVSDSTDAAGNRARVVQVEIASHAQFTERGDEVRRLLAVAETWEGRNASGLGRVVSVNVTESGPERAGAGMTARFTFASAALPAAEAA